MTPAAASRVPAAPRRSPVDFGSPAFLTDPWPVYAELRAGDPVHWSDAAGAFVVLRHRDVKRGLLDHRLSSRSSVTDTRSRFGLGFLDTDGPEHLSLRRLVGPLFSARAVLEHATLTIEPVVNRVLASVEGEDEIDFASRVAAEVPYGVMARLLGLPEADAAWLRERVRAIVPTLDFPPRHGEEALAAMADLEGYVADALTKAATGSRPGPRTALDALASRPERERLRAAIFLLVAGTETSVAAITNVMRCLVTHPAVMRDVWRGRLPVTDVVSETLRWEPSTQSVLRFAREDVEIDGTLVPRRAPVLLSIASANRDEEVFADPERWDPRRPQAKALTFSGGAHACLGLHLAQREFSILYQGLRRRFDAIEPVGDPAPIRGHAFRRPDRLPVRWSIRSDR